MRINVKKIEAMRLEQGYTQRELAKVAGITYDCYIGAVKRGSASNKTVMALALALKPDKFEDFLYIPSINDFRTKLESLEEFRAAISGARFSPAACVPELSKDKIYNYYELMDTLTHIFQAHNFSEEELEMVVYFVMGTIQNAISNSASYLGYMNPSKPSE